LPLLGALFVPFLLIRCVLSLSGRWGGGFFLQSLLALLVSQSDTLSPHVGDEAFFPDSTFPRPFPSGGGRLPPRERGTPSFGLVRPPILQPDVDAFFVKGDSLRREVFSHSSPLSPPSRHPSRGESLKLRIFLQAEPSRSGRLHRVFSLTFRGAACEPLLDRERYWPFFARRRPFFFPSRFCGMAENASLTSKQVFSSQASAFPSMPPSIDGVLPMMMTSHAEMVLFPAAAYGDMSFSMLPVKVSSGPELPAVLRNNGGFLP